MTVSNTVPPDRRNRWMSAFADATGDTFRTIVAHDVTLSGSVFVKAVQGADAVWVVMTTASGIYDSLEFTNSHDAPDRTYLEWRGVAFGRDIAGVTVLVTNADNLITEVRLQHRPLQAVLDFSAELRRRVEGTVDPSNFHERAS